MKKIACLCALFMVLPMILGGCIPIHVPKNYTTLYEISEIESIAIYQRVKGSGLTIGELAQEIPQEQYAELLADLKDLPFEDVILIMLLPAAVDPSFGYGEYTLKITYKNGGYELISDSGYQESCDQDGKTKGTHYSCDEEAWADFIGQYLDG